jgi:DNA-directed RNA polymerase subunit beta
MPISAPELHRFRKNFGKISPVIEIPYLIETLKRNYDVFLQKETPQAERKLSGLWGVFKSVFPITDFNETAQLDIVGYSFDRPKYDVQECRQRGMTFAAPLKINVQLIVWDKDEETGVKSIRDIKEQEIYFGELPLMTENGTFIINGTERVIVSQLHRSPGVFFDHDKGKTHASGKFLYNARIIPYRGSWLDFEFDHRDYLFVKIDRRRKLPATVLLRALGLSEEELLNYFYDTETVFIRDGGKSFFKNFIPEFLAGQKAAHDIVNPKNHEQVIVAKGKKINKAVLRKMDELGVKEIPADTSDIFGKPVAHDLVDPNTGEVILECNQELTEEKLQDIIDRGITQLELLYIDAANVGPYLRETLKIDKIGKENSTQKALIEIYKRLRPGDPPTLDTAQQLFDNLFFNADRYDLSRVGRLKLNLKLQYEARGIPIPRDQGTLSKEDILEVVRYLINLKNGKGQVDDIDHLGNRRVRSVGELLENQYRIGLLRMERAIKERFNLHDIETLMPHDLINSKPVMAVVKEFFGSSQLSQFMDQTNPLSEITHKRRLSALGPGGLTRERAGFEVRDVHTTHYGRICPIETPEGPNIGLIASLSTYARVNEYGFIETPYRLVKDHKVTDEVVYFNAIEEENQVIAQANAIVQKDGTFQNEYVLARLNGETQMVAREEVQLMDVSPTQLVSVAASLIPFLENDDANRALMGSNMQRQAVPLLRAEAPLVGTGMERIVARDSGSAVVARRGGVIDAVDAARIVIKVNENEARGDEPGVDIYNMTKFQRSNQNTCLNQKPLVNRGDVVKAGDIIADGPATEMGELALGKNVMVAFMPWNGYNFEDSILVSERLVKDDTYTSIHIEEFECVARDTKLGREEITRDIPNVGEEALKNLDDSGIIRLGAEVRPNDILVGKITPKGETQLSPEEKLLRAIFGSKAGEVKDTSLRVPPGVVGTIIGARVFNRKGVDKDERALEIENAEANKLRQDKDDEIRIVWGEALSKVRNLVTGKTTDYPLSEGPKKILKKGDKIDAETAQSLTKEQLLQLSLTDKDVEARLQGVLRHAEKQTELVAMMYEEKVDKLKKGDELPPGVIKLVKVYVAIKRKLSVGDKMAGRHGNKGVLSRILPEEDMPYMADGRPVDVVLNPLGVPSRMNVGQILETHLGLSARGLGEQVNTFIEQNYSPKKLRDELKKIYDTPRINKLLDAAEDDQILKVAKRLKRGIHVASPVFDGAREDSINTSLEMADRATTGQMTLYDGRTGEPFHQKVSVGILYVMKLHHLVDDKIHARSIGPYSLVTQQPLGGKAQFGGQRLGEMEVWALEAYGAAYALQEFLTVKSDDVTGRTRMYESVVKGNFSLEPGLPESFNVLIKELQGLALNIELLEDTEEHDTYEGGESEAAE